jgi:nucleoside-diphosphate-sugar epimerase
MNKNILIIGGAGYVGSRLTDQLLKKNFNVTVYDLLIYNKQIFDKHKNNKKFFLTHADIRDIKKLSNSLKQIDTIIHLACISNDPSFDLNPNLGKSINYDCFEPLLHECNKNDIKRFIFASSSSVYGSKKENAVTEELSTEPQTDYAKYKLLCEKTLLNFNSNFIKTIIRPSTICGYSERQRFDLTVNIFANQILNGSQITINGGKQMRPALHIQDMCDLYEYLINCDGDKIKDQIFNVSKEDFTILDVARRIKKILNKKDFPEIINKVIDNRSYKVFSGKIKKILNFEPKFTIEDAVKEIEKANYKNLYIDPINNNEYYNIKKMKEINLK